MSQPCDRSCTIPTPGFVDHSLGEFWATNPWDIVKNGHNLSCFERNRTWLNARGGAFVDLSYLTGMDSDGDGRSVVAGDFNNDGRCDLIVRQVGGGALFLFENEFPQRHYLKVTLRSNKSNRLGVGARLTAYVNGQRIDREMNPVNSYRSQMPNLVHFGLGDAAKVERLQIRWPSGQTQEATDIAADQHVVIDEAADGPAAVSVVTPGQTIRP